jgi:type IV pilus assembly protein PilB
MTPFEDEINYVTCSELFSGLDQPDLESLSQKMKKRIYPSNTAIVREGAAGDAMFIIKKGKVDVKKREASLGIDLTVTTLHDGACFGEMALLTGRPRTASVFTVQDTEVFVLDKKDFEDLLHEKPSIAMTLNRILAARIEEMNLQRGVGVVSLGKITIDPDLFAIVPQQFVNRYKVLPIALSTNTLTLGMVNPNDLLALDEIRKFVRGYAIEPVIMTEEDFKGYMKNVYPTLTKKQEEEKTKEKQMEAIDSFQSDLLKDVQLVDGAEDEIGVSDLEKEAEGAPIIRLANNIIALALKRKASDIHLEPAEKGLRIRYRVDGMLHEEQMLPKKVQLPLISRFKIMSKLDITERRVPQDGRITFKLEDRTIDFRVSTVPTKYGEKICTRILDKEGAVFGLDLLVSHLPTLDMIRDTIKKPYGIIYVTGPTGSGKTTTLYSALSELNNVDVNISTVEDPVEYDLAGVNQVQVNSDIGLDFARVLRAFLRQDPDIILVGETRDKETAKIAVEAALTGHLVFTTLHTNDSTSTFIRLLEMGIEPFLISTSVLGIVAQRLVRKICKKCKEPQTIDPVMAQYLGLAEGTTIYKGKGCDLCNLSGYKGRVGIYEVLVPNDEVKRMVAEGRNTDDIRKQAIESGMKTLKDYGMILVEEGLTTVEEVLRTVVVG